jgi:hypothetical protein
VAHDILIICSKALLGGLLVSVFALLGRVLKPQWLAGLSGASPSIAIASLTVTVFGEGHHAASLAAFGMIFGAVGFVAFGLCVKSLLVRWHATVASTAACLLWFGIAMMTYGFATR